MNSQSLGQSSRSLNLSCQSGRRTGITKNSAVPSLHKLTNASPASIQDKMPPKTPQRRVAQRTSPVKIQIQEDLSRLPDSSSESESDSANLPKTNFVSGSSKEPTTPDYLRRRDAGRKAPPKMGRGTLKKDGVAMKALGDSSSLASGKNSKTTKTSSSTSKRKAQDVDLGIETLGKGMGDGFGRVQIKKGKKLTTFSKNKLVKVERAEKKMTRDSDDDEKPNAGFIFPGSVGTPKKGGFIRPNQDITPKKRFKIPGQNTPKCSPLKKRSKSPEDSGFILPWTEADAPQSSFSNIVVPTRSEITETGSLNSSQAINAVLQDNEIGLGLAEIDAARKIVGVSGTLQQPETKHDIEDDSFLSMTQKARCPMCNKPVDPDDLRAFGYMTIKKQESFCRSHRTKTAKQDWEDREYPTIDWTDLDSRIAKHHSFIKKLINGEDSHYRSILGGKVQAGQDRSTRTMKTNLTPGYYGTRGLRIISENIMKKFTKLIEERMVKDRLMSSRGFTPYVQAVLVPEVAVRLIMEDMKVEEEEAREILVDSVVLGELLNEEIKDVVRKRIEDSDDDMSDG